MCRTFRTVCYTPARLSPTPCSCCKVISCDPCSDRSLRWLGKVCIGVRIRDMIVRCYKSEILLSWIATCTINTQEEGPMNTWGHSHASFQLRMLQHLLLSACSVTCVQVAKKSVCCNTKQTSQLLAKDSWTWICLEYRRSEWWTPKDFHQQNKTTHHT